MRVYVCLYIYTYIPLDNKERKARLLLANLDAEQKA